MRDTQRARPRVEILESRTLLSQSTGAGAGKRLLAELLESRTLLSDAHVLHLHSHANGLLTFQLQTAPAPRNLAKGP
jgi:hypothetical protein